MTTGTRQSDAPTSPRPPADPGRRAWIWLVYVSLYAVSIPWYLPAGERPGIWLGLPSWVVVSVLATTAIATFTVFVVRRCWSDAAGDIDWLPPADGERPATRADATPDGTSR